MSDTERRTLLSARLRHWLSAIFLTAYTI
jgi:hypothetical protein